MDYQNLIFSPKQSQTRVEKASRLLSKHAVNKVLFFALYLLGARLNAIASLTEISEESGKTTIKRVLRDGIAAFQDRRQSAKTRELQSASEQKQQVSVLIQKGYCIITFGDIDHQLKIPQNHRVHLRSVLLSLLKANLLSINTVSSILGLTEAHCRDLSAKLQKDGVTKVLIDKRKGQKHDYRVDLSVKAELIQIFAARAVTGHSVSSQTLTDLINTTKKHNPFFTHYTLAYGQTGTYEDKEDSPTDS